MRWGCHSSTVVAWATQPLQARHPPPFVDGAVKTATEIAPDCQFGKRPSPGSHPGGAAREPGVDTSRENVSDDLDGPRWTPGAESRGHARRIESGWVNRHPEVDSADGSEGPGEHFPARIRAR